MFTQDKGRQTLLMLSTPVAALFLVLGGCQQPTTQAPDTRAADESAIRAIADDQAKAIVAFDPVKAASFYTDDVVSMAPDAPLIRGKDNMQKYLETMLKEKPGFSFSMVQVEVARSGDLAYCWGTGKLTAKDKRGKAVETTFKSITVLKKQADGVWKMVVDTFVPDPPQKKP